MKPTKMRRHTQKGRLKLANAIAADFDYELIDVRHFERGVSMSPLTDLVWDGMLLTRLAAAFDGYDFEFAEEHEPHSYRFKLRLLAAALSVMVLDKNDLGQAIEDAKALIRERHEEEETLAAQNAGRGESGMPILHTMGFEKFRDL